MTIDIEKAKQVLATLQREKQEQEERLQRAREAKKRLIQAVALLPKDNNH